MTREEISVNARLKKERKIQERNERRVQQEELRNIKKAAETRKKIERALFKESEKKAREEKREKHRVEKILIRENAIEKDLLERIVTQLGSDNYLAFRIEELIRRDESNKNIIKWVFFNIRNAPYEISHPKIFKLSFIEDTGNVQEHINGRTAFATYFLWARATGEINTLQDCIDFYKKYDVWINTTNDFNTNVIKPFQNEEGAIDPKIYIEKYEETFGALSPAVKQKFSEHFLYLKYGTITREYVINYYRNKLALNKILEENLVTEKN